MVDIPNARERAPPDRQPPARNAMHAVTTGPRRPITGSAPGRGIPERILIADDNPFNLRLLRRILSNEADTVLEAEDGARALELACEGRPDLILLDVRMPGLDGYEVARALQRNPATADVPILFLSGLTDANSRIRGLESGAVDYITKPFHKDEVLARVRSQLKLRRLTRALREANADLHEKQRRLDEDLEAAAAIQRSLLPARGPTTDRVTAAWRYRPCQRSGGDLFSFHELTSDAFAFHVIDVAGHGVPAAMMTVALSQSLSADSGATRERSPGSNRLEAVAPADVLRRLDADYPIDRFDRHFTIAYLLLDLATGLLRYSLAGHPHPVVVRRDGRLEPLKCGGTIIGLGGAVPFDEGRLHLRAGDRVFVFTDGIPEACDPAGHFFGESALHRTLHATRAKSLDAACGHVVESVQRFTGARPFDDDVTLFAIEYEGPAGKRHSRPGAPGRSVD